MAITKTVIILTSVSVGIVAFIFSGHLVHKTILNLLFSLFAIILGSSIGVLLFIFFLNFLEKRNFYSAHSSSLETFLRHFHLNLEVPDGETGIDENESSIKKAKLKLRRFCNNLQIFCLKAVYRLINSPMVKEQIGKSSVTDVGNSRNPSVYELIRPYGQTPDDMLASAYGPTAMGRSANAICVSKKIDEIMHKIFEYTYRDYVEIW